MTNGRRMSDYLDNLIEEEIGSTGPVDDMDIPLLDNNTLESGLTKKRCLYQQAGFDTPHNAESNKDASLKIIMATSLCSVFMITEFVGGYLAGSLAIMTDAAHLMSDCISFIIGLIAIWLSSRPADRKMSFGYKRIEVLGAMVSILGIWLLTSLLVYFAIQRIVTNEFDIDADTMMIIAGIGIIINIIMGSILHGSFNFSFHQHSHTHSPKNETSSYNIYSQNEDNHLPTFITNHERNEIRPRQGSFCNSREIQKHPGVTCPAKEENTMIPDSNNEAPFIEIVHSELCSSEKACLSNERNLNLRAALIHVLGDFVQSVGVFIAAVIIKFQPSAKIADPLCTLLFSVIVVLTTVKIIKESISIILNAVPSSICLVRLESDLTSIEGVRSVHHINVWSQTSNYNLMMAHLTIDEFADSNEILKMALNLAYDKYNIKHSTLQVEKSSGAF